MKKIFAALLIIAAFTACDKIEGPYLTPDNSVSTDIVFPELNPNDVYRKVLIEEYTGHRCTNCPDGHRELENLQGRYGDTLIAIGIHAGTFSAPTSTFPNDFRTEDGATLYTDYQVATIGTPAGVVGRAQYNNAYALNISSWQQAIGNNMQQPCVAAVQVINVFDPNSKMLTAHTKTTLLNGYNEEVQIALYIIEDDIIGPQKDGETTISDYVHKHVFRGSMNGTYGVALNAPEEDGTFLKSYSMDCSQNGWNCANCSVVAVLMNAATHEVLQVEQVSFF